MVDLYSNNASESGNSNSVRNLNSILNFCNLHINKDDKILLIGKLNFKLFKNENI